MGYDVARDFTPVSVVETSPFVLVVNPALPVRDLKEFIALGRARPGKLTFGTLGAGQIPYWSVMLFNSMAAVEAVEVQDKAPPDATVDIIAGRLDYSFLPVGNAVRNREKPRALRGTPNMRAEMLPDLPTIAEA